MVAIHGLLLATLDQCRGKTLLVADENCLDFPFASLDSSVRVISNRVDVAAQADGAGLTARFCDFRFSEVGHGLDDVVYRISKEKPVVHHIANGAAGVLADGGRLRLLGGKQEGIKTFATTIGSRFQCSPRTEKQGALYTAILEKQTAAPGELDDRDYHRLREIHSLDGKPVLSKPGLFGWDKIDRGSALLAAHLSRFLAECRLSEAPSLLDLGCGYGYLSLMAARLGRFTVTATDNCAAALLACEENFSVHGVGGRVVGADCADGIHGGFDVVLCNPPFHQGFHQERKLTEKFLAATRRLLTRRGSALFVVNQFVPLESLARPVFREIRVTAAADGFKLVALA